MWPICNNSGATAFACEIYFYMCGSESGGAQLPPHRSLSHVRRRNKQTVAHSFARARGSVELLTSLVLKRICTRLIIRVISC